MKKLYEIDEFFPAAGDPRFSMTATSPLDSVEYAIFTADDFVDAAIYDYGERKCLFPETDTPLASFYARFARWKAQRGTDIAAAYGALHQQYNPLENYDSTEQKTGTETALKTPDEWVQTIEREPDLTKTETQTPDQWKSTVTESGNNYHEITTETPGLNRGYTDTESFTNYHETETQTPTNWIEHKTEGVGQAGYKESDLQTPTNWIEHRTEGVGQDGYTESDLQTPTNWIEHRTEGVGQDGYKESDLQTPDDWAETTTALQADNQTDASSSVYAFNSSDAVKVSASDVKTKNKSTTERTGTYLTEHSIEGSKETETERTGTYLTEHSIEGSKETETQRTGTYQTDKQIAGNKQLAHVETGTLETDSTISGSKQTETAQTGTFETVTAEEGSDTTTVTQAGTFEDKMTYNTTIRKHGNIGIRSAQELAEQELALRSKQFVRDVIREFFDLVSVYC